MALPVASLHQQTQIPFTLARKTLDDLLVGGRQQLIHVLHPLLLPVLVLRLTPHTLPHQQQPVPVGHLTVRQPRRVRRVVHDVLHAVLELLLQLLLRARRHACQVLLLHRVALKRPLPSLQPPVLPPLLLRLTPPARAHRRRHLLLKLLTQRGRAAVEPPFFADLRLMSRISAHVQQRLPDQLRLQGDRRLEEPVRTEHALARVLGCLRSGRVAQRPQGVVAGGLEQIDFALDRSDAFDLLVHAHVAEQVQRLNLHVRGPARRYEARDGLEHHAVGEKQTRQQEALAIGLLIRAQQLRVRELVRPHVAHLVQRLVQNVLTRLDRLGVRRPRVAPPLRTRVAPPPSSSVSHPPRRCSPRSAPPSPRASRARSPSRSPAGASGTRAPRPSPPAGWPSAPPGSTPGCPSLLHSTCCGTVPAPASGCAPPARVGRLHLTHPPHPHLSTPCPAPPPSSPP